MVDKLIIKKSKLSEVYNLAPRLREDDEREVKAAGRTVKEALEEGFYKGKECYSVFTQNNKLIGMFGYSIIEKDVATIWFLGSDEIEKYPLTFVKEGKKFINRLNKKYTLVNCVHSKNITHIKYIEHLGCQIKYDIPVFSRGEIFYPFIKNKRG